MLVIPITLSLLALLTPIHCQKSHQKSLVIVFDGTGSMGNNLQELIPAANSIIDNFASRLDKPIHNFILTVFHDPTIDPTINSQNNEDLKRGLKNIRLHNDGDVSSGEKSITGLKQSLEHALHNSIVFLITDDEGNDYAKESEVVSILQRKQITVHVLLAECCKVFTTPGCKVYENISRLSNGLLVNLDTTKIQDILKNLGRTIDPEHQLITKFIQEAAGFVNSNVSVDQSIQEICGSVSGANPQLSFTDSNNEKIKLVSEIAMDRFKFGCIKDPSSGFFEFEAKSDSAFTARVDARSKLKFEFGFSIEPVKFHSETNTLPLNGHRNILTIFPSDQNLVQTISHVYIRSKLNENELVLKKISNGVFATERFDLPNEPFEIRVKGLDSIGFPFDRIISASLVAESGSAPEMSVESTEMSLCTNEKFLLKCKVKSQIPIKIQWSFNGVLQQEISANQSKELNLEFDNFDVNRKGIYKCDATNVKGTDMKQISVNIFKVPKIKFTTFNTDFTENQEYELKCDTSDAESNSEIKWIDQDGKELSKGFSTYNFFALRKYDGKSISCQVTNTKCTAKDTKTFLIKYVPRFKDETIPEITNKIVKFGETVKLDCESDRVPARHKIYWYLHTFENKTIEQEEQRERDVIELPATKASDGIFECKISNELKPAKRQFNFTITALASPKITTTKQIYTFNEGEKVELICECSMCLPIVKSTWIYGNALNVENTKTEIGNSLHSILSITNVDHKQAGKFKCSMENNLGKDEVEVELIIQTAPKVENVTMKIDEKLTKIDQEIEILEGKNAEFSCFAESIPSAKIYWTFNNSKISLKNSFKLQNVSNIHEGLYECVAENAVRKTIKFFKISLNFPPKIKSEQIKNLHFTHKSPAVINCDIFGEPKPEIKWKFNDKEVYGYSGSKYELKNDRYTLEFIAGDGDEGIFSCVGVNEFGKTSMDFKVTVNTAPIFIKANNENVKIKKGFNLEINCEATAVPPPAIKIIRDGLILIESEMYLKPNISMSDAGIYQCIAENDVKSSTKYFNVTVVEAPTVTTNFMNVSLKDEDSIEITCDAEGVPTPTIKWFFEKSTVMSNNKTLNLTTRENRGIYECVAENSEGSDSRDFYADIQKLNAFKNISDISTEINVKESDNFELLCPYTNYESIKWTFNAAKLPKNLEKIEVKNRLKINNIKREFNGDFLCEVKDSRDTFTFRYKINILASSIIKASWQQNETLLEYPEDSDIEEFQFSLYDKMKLSCEANGNPEPIVTWFKSNKQILKNYNLIVDGLDHASSGVYSCVAQNSQGETKKFFKVDVAGAPQLKSNLNQTTLNLNVMDNITLHCDVIASPPPKYVWFKNREEITTEHDSILKLYNISYEDDGAYLCLAFNSHGSTRQKFKIFVSEAPKILEPSTNDLVYRNGPGIKLTCIATGNPLPQFWWNGPRSTRGMSNSDNIKIEKKLRKKSAVYFDQEGKIIEKLNKSKGLLETSILTKIDAKTFKFETTITYHERMMNLNFTCRVRNQHGEVTRSAFIRKYQKPLDEKSKERKTINKIFLQDQTLTLECPLSGYPPSTYSWTKNDLPIKNNVKLLKDGKIISLGKTKEEHAGLYSCTGRNVEGEGRSVFEIVVNSKPRFRDKKNSPQSIEHIDVLRGNDAVLECWFDGLPKPDIIWEKRNKNESKILGKDNNVYVAHNVRSAQIIACVIKNNLGSIEKSFSLNPVYQPEFIDPLPMKMIAVTEDDQISFDCLNQANPKGETIWFKNSDEISQDKPGFIFSSSNQELKILRAKISFNGTFSCISNNSLGSVKKIFEVRVNPAVIYHNWAEWSDCRASCDSSGIQHRMRHCEIISKANLSHSCENTYEVKTCFKKCWGEWSKWSKCPECKLNENERHEQDRSRTCVAKRLEECKGKSYERRDCELDMCSENYGWSEWSDWNEECPICKVEENEKNYQTRDRLCKSIRGCRGSKRQIKECEIPLCLEDYGFNVWSDWSECPACKSSQNQKIYQKRFRSCENGKRCRGKKSDEKLCELPICPQDENWSAWSEWDRECPACKSTASEKHYQRRNRTCLEGKSCKGREIEQNECEIINFCPNDNWSDWDEWDKECPTCKKDLYDRPLRTRFRNCKGKIDVDCIGLHYEREECFVPLCSEVTTWSDWTEWNVCPACKTDLNEEHFQTRERTCLSKTCKGDRKEFKECNLELCPEENFWGPWTEWTKCPPCHFHGKPMPKQTRFRKCKSEDNRNCKGVPAESQICPLDDCVASNAWTDWSRWSECSRTCGNGIQMRKRVCVIGPGKCSGGSDKESKICKIKDCVRL